jgi:hypothetical protein
MNGSNGISFPTHLPVKQKRGTRLRPLKLKAIGTSLQRSFARSLSGTALGVPLNKLGNPHLKPTNKPKPNAPRLSTQGMAHAAVAPTAHQGGPLKRSPRTGSASLEGARLPRAGAAPLEGVRLPRAGSASLEGAHLPRAGAAPLEGVRLPRASSASLVGPLRPRAGSTSLEGAPHTRACSRTRHLIP